MVLLCRSIKSAFLRVRAAIVEEGESELVLLTPKTPEEANEDPRFCFCLNYVAKNGIRLYCVSLGEVYFNS